MQVCAPRQNKWQQIKRLVMLWHPSRYNCDRGRIMHNSSFCRMAFTRCICLLFSGCAASLSDANAKGKETVTESTSQTDSVDLTQPSDGSSDAAQMKIISSANGNRREDQERQYVQSGFLQIPVCRTNPQQITAVRRTPMILHINNSEYDYHTLV